MAADTVVGMTAAAVNPFDASPVPVLPPDTAPAAIRDALIGEERDELERAYREALAEAAETLDLTRVLDMLTVLQGQPTFALMDYHTWQTRAVGPPPQLAVHRGCGWAGMICA